MPIQRVPSLASYTPSWGYCRAIRVVDRVLVAGTSASKPDGTVHTPGDPYAQAVYVLDIIEAALGELGASVADVVLTRAFLTDIALWQEVGRAHFERFGDSVPVSTCIGGIQLMHPDLLVEFEAEAMVHDG